MQTHMQGHHEEEMSIAEQRHATEIFKRKRLWKLCFLYECVCECMSDSNEEQLGMRCHDNLLAARPQVCMSVGFTQ